MKIQQLKEKKIQAGIILFVLIPILLGVWLWSIIEAISSIIRFIF